MAPVRGNAEPHRNDCRRTPRGKATLRKQTFEQTTTQDWIKEAATFATKHNLPLLPAAFPITTFCRDGRKLLIYRDHWGIKTLNASTGGLEWKAPSHWSLDMMVSSPRKQTDINTWVNYYLQTLQKPTLLFENSTVGTLSTDNTFLFAIEDLAVSPPPTMGAEFDPRFGQGGAVFPREQIVRDAVQHNKLQAYDLVTGKLKWEAGGRGQNAGDLADAFFLGAPLPLDGKVYSLIEKEGKIQLVCLAQRSGMLLSSVVLFYPLLSELLLDLKSGKLKDAGEVSFPSLPLRWDPLRRMRAAHLAFAEGRMICPTNAGAIVMVDLKTNKAVWTYNYREQERDGEKERNGLAAMQVTAPIISQGKVVFTAPDSRSVHCLDLQNGKPLWTRLCQQDDLFLAGVFDGKVLLAGKRKVRALSLAKGEQLWGLEVGLPSGQGIASDHLYYLPLRAAMASGEPEICAIDFNRGTIQGRAPWGKKEVPGNLLFVDDKVISQTLSELSAFAQRKGK